MKHGVRAALMLGPGEIGLGEFPYLSPLPGAVIVKMEMSGVCGTDKHTFEGRRTGTPGPRLRPIRRFR